jgi:hypothetical protein
MEKNSLFSIDKFFKMIALVKPVTEGFKDIVFVRNLL